MRVRTALSVVLVAAGCLAAAEAGRRVLDDFRLTRLRLIATAAGVDLTVAPAAGASAADLVRSLPRDPQVNVAWFSERPGADPPTPAWVSERRALGHDREANYVWNRAALNLASELTYFESVKDRLPDVFIFRTPGDNPRPPYRGYPGVDAGFGYTNQFGWKGREITLAKPANVVRIATLGDSTTGRYPRLVDFWLNRWAETSHAGVRFEVLDGSRPGIDALDAAAVYAAEIAPGDPDFVVVYGFGNAINDAESLIPVPPEVRAAKPAPGILARWSAAIQRRLEPIAPWSAAALFLQQRLASKRSDGLAVEPSKPRTRVTFPDGISEDAPDPAAIAAYTGGHVMGLDQYMQALNLIDASARRTGTRLYVSSFRLMARDGQVLPEGGAIYRTLNGRSWWPYTYAQVVRLMAFYNRALRAWTMRTGNSAVPFDEQMPFRPALYGDVMHELPDGAALHAWIVVQQLLPAIREGLRAGRLPHHTPNVAAGYSDTYWKIDRLSTREAIAIGKAMNAPPPPPVFDEIPAAFQLSKLVSRDPDARVEPGPVPRVTTSPVQSRYAASLPIEPAVAAGAAGPGRVEVRLRVTAGQLSVGVLNKSEQKFLAAANISPSQDITVVQLDVSDVAQIGSVMVSNARPESAARSTGDVYGVTLKKPR